MPSISSPVARGAVAGAASAAVWWAQQPLDMRAFRVPYDDAALLGTAFSGGRAAGPLGVAIHVANGAAFGAAYGWLSARPGLGSLPPAARGPAAGLAEHLASWPGVGLVERWHPRRDRLPALAGNRAAFAQATWRHLLFGALLGGIDRALTPPPPVDSSDAPL
jgi:hypothetical protein